MFARLSPLKKNGAVVIHMHASKKFSGFITCNLSYLCVSKPNCNDSDTNMASLISNILVIVLNSISRTQNYTFISKYLRKMSLKSRACRKFV